MTAPAGAPAPPSRDRRDRRRGRLRRRRRLRRFGGCRAAGPRGQRRRRRPGRLSLTGAVLGLTFGAMSVTPSLVPRGLVPPGAADRAVHRHRLRPRCLRRLGLPGPRPARPAGRRPRGSPGRCWPCSPWSCCSSGLARPQVAVRPARAARHGHLRAAGSGCSGRCWDCWSPRCSSASAGRSRPSAALLFRPLGRVLPARVAWLIAIVVTGVAHAGSCFSGLLFGNALEVADCDLREQQQRRQARGGQPRGRHPVGWADLGGHVGEHRPRGARVRRVRADGRADLRASSVTRMPSSRCGRSSGSRPRRPRPSGRSSPSRSCARSAGSTAGPSPWRAPPAAAGSTPRRPTRSSTRPTATSPPSRPSTPTCRAGCPSSSTRAGRRPTPSSCITALRVELDGMPADQRPDLYVYGESLGAFSTDSAFTSVEDMSTTTDGALLIGPPSFDTTWQKVVAGREAGSPVWKPLYGDGGLVRVATTDADLTDQTLTWTTDNPIIYLTHASDPIVAWTADHACVARPARPRRQPAGGRRGRWSRGGRRRSTSSTPTECPPGTATSTTRRSSPPGRRSSARRRCPTPRSRPSRRRSATCPSEAVDIRNRGRGCGVVEPMTTSRLRHGRALRARPRAVRARRVPGRGRGARRARRRERCSSRPLHGTTELRLLLARSYYHSAQLGRAERVTRAILADVPDDAYANLVLGRTLQRQGRHAEAKPHLAMAELLGGYAGVGSPPARRRGHPRVTDYGHELEFGLFPSPDAARRAPRARARRAWPRSAGSTSSPCRTTRTRRVTSTRGRCCRSSRPARRTLRVALNVANLPLRNPVVLAGSVATLDLLSGGRVELGLGAGGVLGRHRGRGRGRGCRPGEAVDALEEAIGVIRGDVGRARAACGIDGEHHRARGPALRAGAGAPGRHLGRRLQAADAAAHRAARRRLAAEPGVRRARRRSAR